MERATAGLWRKITPRYNLQGNECKNCGKAYFPPRIVCPKCGRNSKMVEKKFKGTGEILSFTRISAPPDAFEDEAPYTIGIVKLDEGPMVEGHIIENGREIKIGTKVNTVFRKMYTEGDEGLIHYHYKFEPL